MMAVRLLGSNNIKHPIAHDGEAEETEESEESEEKSKVINPLLPLFLLFPLFPLERNKRGNTTCARN
ncbi:hypothetical protein A2454_02260 [Candidatus Peribacteria bacterium RIFOXYC2_FULL_55_14]|nr:MAG: hypothetical protein A2198_05660 [Candidatus Peribacteria bacterium RIFOXYA1_FULL_56_14]OGJ74395.1 MAG: hypothetical protein A2384_06750 [Candidatus Peribacteria bacterium RIFOXYB1_FULL_54_35]OGJ75070.1 MAG: hypothetical protein A2217_05055 [Candidatus Peribacteria bacterium RIFOXYA2_FULL_55_28]OGJ76014.1 MAG: hypothetical protein A2327_03895 [Candidatus Peribacteria bacterium RIFOXYB2_FULL_54_17]OGJ77503.1 MAG: hypothetical protein A2424_04085 [Candidatus Peribacteria bacterium RIFOXYC